MKPTSEDSFTRAFFPTPIRLAGIKIPYITLGQYCMLQRYAVFAPQSMGDCVLAMSIVRQRKHANLVRCVASWERWGKWKLWINTPLALAIGYLGDDFLEGWHAVIKVNTTMPDLSVASNPVSVERNVPFPWMLRATLIERFGYCPKAIWDEPFLLLMHDFAVATGMRIENEKDRELLDELKKQAKERV